MSTSISGLVIWIVILRSFLSLPPPTYPVASPGVKTKASVASDLPHLLTQIAAPLRTILKTPQSPQLRRAREVGLARPSGG
jgi:hypothetical protein